jgi:hypothetical protein
MGMGIYQTRQHIPAWQPLRARDWISGQAPGIIHPQIDRPVAIGQLHRSHGPRHLDSIHPARANAVMATAVSARTVIAAHRWPGRPGILFITL